MHVLSRCACFHADSVLEQFPPRAVRERTRTRPQNWLSRGSINGVNAWYFDFGTFKRAITGITVIAFNKG
jgi:hypothetical protein